MEYELKVMNPHHVCNLRRLAPERNENCPGNRTSINNCWSVAQYYMAGNDDKFVVNILRNIMGDNNHENHHHRYHPVQSIIHVPLSTVMILRNNTVRLA